MQIIQGAVSLLILNVQTLVSCDYFSTDTEKGTQILHLRILLRMLDRKIDFSQKLCLAYFTCYTVYGYLRIYNYMAAGELAT